MWIFCADNPKISLKTPKKIPNWFRPPSLVRGQITLGSFCDFWDFCIKKSQNDHKKSLKIPKKIPKLLRLPSFGVIIILNNAHKQASELQKSGGDILWVTFLTTITATKGNINHLSMSKWFYFLGIFFYSNQNERIVLSIFFLTLLRRLRNSENTISQSYEFGPIQPCVNLTIFFQRKIQKNEISRFWKKKIGLKTRRTAWIQKNIGEMKWCVEEEIRKMWQSKKSVSVHKCFEDQSLFSSEIIFKDQKLHNFLVLCNND